VRLGKGKKNHSPSFIHNTSSKKKTLRQLLKLHNAAAGSKSGRDKKKGEGKGKSHYLAATTNTDGYTGTGASAHRSKKQKNVINPILG